MSVDDTSERQREIGQRVARWRACRGLTRRQFADLCGRSLSWVDKVKSGEQGLLRLPMLERVAEVLTETAGVRQAKHWLDVFEIAAIRAASQSYQAISRVFVPPVAELSEPPSLDRLARQVTYAWTAFQNAHWPLLGQALPRLLTAAQDRRAWLAAERGFSWPRKRVTVYSSATPPPTRARAYGDELP